MKNVFDVTDFGAVGDGVTDCTAAIQTALNKAGEAKGCVAVPPGKFMCGELTVPPSVSLMGFSGWGYREYGGSILSLNDENADCLLNLTGAHGCRISGLQLLGGEVKKVGVCGIGVFWNNYDTRDNYELFKEENRYPEATQEGFREDSFVIENCQVKNFSGDGIHLQHMFAFTVKGCMIMANGGNAIYLTGWDGWITDNIMHTNGGAAIYSDDNFSSFSITGNRIEWNHNGGINVAFGGSLNINNNCFDRAYGPSVQTRGGKYRSNTITLTGNIFRRSGKYRHDFEEDPFLNSHILLNETDSTVITANVFGVGKDDHDKGTPSPDYSVVLKNCGNCVVTSNSMVNGSLKQNTVVLGGKRNIIKDNAE